MKQLNRNEISERITAMEHRIDFIMKIAQATIAVGSHLDPGGLQKQIISFKDLYRELYSNGAELVDVDPAVQQAAAAVAVGRGSTEAVRAANGGEAADAAGSADGGNEPAPGSELTLGGVKVSD